VFASPPYRISQSIRDEFGSKQPIMAHAVWPYQSGEVVVQNYNTLLTLAALQRSCDGVIFHRNSVVNELLQARYSLKNVAFGDVNAFVARELASVLLPAKDDSGALHKMPIYQLIGDLCSHPAFKSLSIRSLPQIRNKRDGFLTYSTDLLLSYLHQLSLNGKFNEDAGNLKFKTPSNATFAQNLYFRGKSDVDFAKKAGTIFSPTSSHFSTALSPRHRLNVYQTKKSFMSFESFLSAVSNDQTMVDPMEEMVAKAWDMFNNKSFLHRYEKYDIDGEFFVNAFAQTEQIIHSMKTLPTS
jgi:tubulin delta